MAVLGLVQWRVGMGSAQPRDFGRLSRTFLSMLFVGCFCADIAIASSDYYQASVPVGSQAIEARKAAAEQAFADVIVRISGSELALEHPAIVAAQNKAISYVEQFQYQESNIDERERTGRAEKIVLSFSAPAIERLLRKSDQPFWPVNRPSTLVWLVEDSLELGKQFITSDIAAEVLSGFESAAAARGLPLTYPLLDLQDQMKLTAEELWLLDEEAILVASQRYDVDVVFVGRYSSTSRGEYLATWQFFHRGDSRVYDSRLDNPSVLGRYALNPLADYLGARYAIVPRDDVSPALVMQLTGIDSFAGYRRALDYLEGLAATSNVMVTGVRKHSMWLSLGSEAGVEKFISVLSLDGRMVEEEVSAVSALPTWQQAAQGTVENPLRYRWQR